ncbi:FHA domain-containing protein [Nocardia sp. NPDC004722]
MQPESNVPEDTMIECPHCGVRGPRALQCRVCGGDLIVTASPPSEAPSVESDAPRAEPVAAVELIVSSGARLRVVAGQTIGLGRHEDYPAAAVFEPYTNVSRMHGALRYDGETLYVTDTSANGTFINDVRIPQNEECVVCRADTLRLAADVPVTIEWGP